MDALLITMRLEHLRGNDRKSATNRAIPIDALEISANRVMLLSSFQASQYNQEAIHKQSGRVGKPHSTECQEHGLLRCLYRTKPPWILFPHSADRFIR